MKNNNNSLGNKNNMNSIKASLSNMKSEMRPTISLGRIRSAPKQLRLARDAWVNRTVRVFVGGKSTVTLTFGALMAKLRQNTNDTNDVKVLALKVWNATGPGNSTNYVYVISSPDLTTTGVTQEAEDIGHASSLPGVCLNIPNVLAKTQTVNSISGEKICEILPNPLSPTVNIDQYYCVDIEIATRSA